MKTITTPCHARHQAIVKCRGARPTTHHSSRRPLASKRGDRRWTSPLLEISARIQELKAQVIVGFDGCPKSGFRASRRERERDLCRWSSFLQTVVNMSIWILEATFKFLVLNAVIILLEFNFHAARTLLATKKTMAVPSIIFDFTLFLSFEFLCKPNSTQ